MEFDDFSPVPPEADTVYQEDLVESRRARWLTVLAVLAAQTWLAILVFVAVYYWAGGRTSDEAGAHIFRAAPQCTSQAPDRTDCPLSPKQLLLPTVDRSHHVLVHSAHRVPCSFIDGAAAMEAVPLPQAIRAVQSSCGLEYLGEPDLPSSLCELLEANPCGLYLVSGDELRSCATVVAGPFGQDGGPVAAARMEPLVTVMPGVSFSPSLLSIYRARGFARDSERMPEYWAGSASSGWLVLPLLTLGKSDVHSAMAVLGHMAGAVSQPSKPDPVLVDLAGLLTCPSEEQLVETMRVIHTLGLRPVGYIPANNNGEQTRVRLVHEAEERARFLSYRVVSEERAACPTLPSTSTAGVIDRVEAVLASMESETVPLVVLLHWPVAGVSDEHKEDTIRTLLEMGVFVAAGMDPGVPRTVTTGSHGFGVVGMGSYLDDRVLASAAGTPSGVMLQCSRLNELSPVCTVTPIAHSLGEPVPVTSGKCATCALLPPLFFSRLWDTRSCNSR